MATTIEQMHNTIEEHLLANAGAEPFSDFARRVYTAMQLLETSHSGVITIPLVIRDEISADCLSLMDDLILLYGNIGVDGLLRYAKTSLASFAIIGRHHQGWGDNLSRMELDILFRHVAAKLPDYACAMNEDDPLKALEDRFREEATALNLLKTAVMQAGFPFTDKAVALFALWLEKHMFLERFHEYFYDRVDDAPHLEKMYLEYKKLSGVPVENLLPMVKVWPASLYPTASLQEGLFYLASLWNMTMPRVRFPLYEDPEGSCAVLQEWLGWITDHADERNPPTCPDDPHALIKFLGTEAYVLYPKLDMADTLRTCLALLAQKQ